MKKVKDDISFCVHCKLEMMDNERIDCKCPKCGNDDFEEVLTEEWMLLSENEKADILQEKEDNQMHNSVRLSH